jgi:hypothetical protein
MQPVKRVMMEKQALPQEKRGFTILLGICTYNTQEIKVVK